MGSFPKAGGMARRPYPGFVSLNLAWPQAVIGGVSLLSVNIFWRCNIQTPERSCGSKREAAGACSFVGASLSERPFLTASGACEPGPGSPDRWKEKAESNTNPIVMAVRGFFNLEAPLLEGRARPGLYLPVG